MTLQAWSRRWLDRLWQLVSLYLPVVLMALLAAGVYWLVRNTPLPPTTPVERPLRQDPDYFMHNVTLQRFNPDGTPRTRVWGDQARHFPATQMLEIDNVRVHAVGEDGQVLVASADRGETNNEQTDVRLHGDARVVRLEGQVRSADGGCVVQPRLELRSEFLHIDIQNERISTDQRAQLQRGDSRITADSLQFDNRKQEALFEGHVRTELASGARASAPECPP